MPLDPEIMPAEPAAIAAPNNGNGRPKGARNLKHQMLDRLLRSQSREVLQKVIDQAKEGDMVAAKLLMDRFWPRPRIAPIVGLDLPETRNPAELRAAMHELLRKVATGEITPDAGAAIVQICRDVLDAHRGAPENPSAAAEETRTRDLLFNRLMRQIDDRRAAALPAAELVPAPAAELPAPEPEPAP